MANSPDRTSTKLEAVTHGEQDQEMPQGFWASLKGASLSDLVQLQCLSGTDCVARVSSGDEVGYLYFRDGRVVHAMSPSHVGEPAAFEILGWNTGTFELCNAGWPENESIHDTFQALLIRAAQARDESGRHALARFARARTQSGEQVRVERRVAIERGAAPPDAKRMPSVPAPVTGMSKVHAVHAAVRVDANGQVVTSRGVGGEILGDAASLATRLARLTGEALGLDGLVSIEASTASQRTLVVIEPTGCILAVCGPVDADFSARARALRSLNDDA
ncbi:MAG: DUF4388 domain-containing protein [Myxococcota bacterium]